MTRSHVRSRTNVLLLGALLIGLVLQSDVAGAQRVLTIDEQQRADARRRQQAEQQRDAAKKQAQIEEDKKARESRMAAAGAGTPGLAVIKADTIIVTRNRVVFMYKEPEVSAELANGERFGHYVWRWDVNEGATAFSLVFTSDSAMRTANLGDIVKAGRVRQCASIYETSARACTAPVEAVVTRLGAGFRIEVSDTALVNAVRVGTPRSATAIVFAPLGRAVSSTARFVYADPGIKSERP